MPGLKLPKQLETFFVPPNYSLRFHDDQSVTPVTPDTGKQNPEETVYTANLGPLYRLFHDGQLLAECKVFQNKIGGLFESQNMSKSVLGFILIIEAYITSLFEKVNNFNVELFFARDTWKSTCSL